MSEKVLNTKSLKDFIEEYLFYDQQGQDAYGKESPLNSMPVKLYEAERAVIILLEEVVKVMNTEELLSKNWESNAQASTESGGRISREQFLEYTNLKWEKEQAVKK